jgi:hypothetical protein
MQDWQGILTYTTMEWEGDTIIDNESYTKIYIDGLFVGGVRQNIPLEQVFLYNQGIEYDISFNQNAGIGDTIPILPQASIVLTCGTNPLYDMVIDDVDSTLINGAYRKVFTMHSVQQGDLRIYTLTSGVGMEIEDLEYAYSILCHYDEGTLLVGNAQNPMCALSINKSDLLKFNLFPNPATNEIRIVPTNEDDYTVRIFENSGRLVPQSRYSAHNELINTSKLSPGAYTIELSTQNSIFTKKFIKQ